MGGAFKWPTVEEVVKYRTKVKNVVIEVIETAPLHLPIHHDHPWVSIIIYTMTISNDLFLLQWSLIMGIEHERYNFSLLCMKIYM